MDLAGEEPLAARAEADLHIAGERAGRVDLVASALSLVVEGVGREHAAA